MPVIIASAVKKRSPVRLLFVVNRNIRNSIYLIVIIQGFPLRIDFIVQLFAETRIAMKDTVSHARYIQAVNYSIISRPELNYRVFVRMPWAAVSYISTRNICPNPKLNYLQTYII